MLGEEGDGRKGGRGEGRRGGEERGIVGDMGEGRWERVEGREGRWVKGMISENLSSVQEWE